MRRQIRSEMDQLIFGAGFGTAILSKPGYITAKYYHWVIAALTIAIIWFEAAQVSLQMTLFWLIAYLLYFLARQLANTKYRRIFYRSSVQLFRVQLGILIVTHIIYSLGAKAPDSSLWLLFVLILQVASKHCSTWILVVSFLESCLILFLVYLNLVGTSFTMNLLWSTWIPQCLWIVILTFILHYLVRNIDARDETIDGYELVNTLSSQLDTLPNPRDKWETVLQTCIGITQGCVGLFWICDHNTERIELRAQVEGDLQRPGRQKAIPHRTHQMVHLDEDNLIARTVREGAPCYWHAGTETATYLGGRKAVISGPVLACDLHSLMLVPVVEKQGASSKTIALLGVGFECGKPPRQRVLMAYQSLLTDMIHHIKPLFFFERHLQEVEILQQMVRDVSCGIDLDQVIESLLACVVDKLGFEFATVSLIDTENQLIRTVKGLNVPEAWIKSSVHSLESKDIQADIVRSGETTVLEGWDERFHRKIWERFSHGEMIRIFTPILVVDQKTNKDKVVGVVEAGYRKQNRNHIDEDQVRILKTFVQQASVAIEKAQIMAEMERQTRILTSLHKASHAIGTVRELPKVLDEIAQSAERVLGADVIMLYRYSHEEHHIQPPVIYGSVWGHKPLNVELREGGILHKILADKAPHYAPDALNDPYLTKNPLEPDHAPKSRQHRSFTERQNIKSFAGIPLIAKGRTVGIMCVNYRKRHRFSENEKHIHELFAQQVALALENAQANELIRELAAREERNHLSRELHDSLSQYLPAIGIMVDTTRSLIPSRPEAALEWLDKIQNATRLASQKAKLTIFQLRSISPQHGLPIDLHWLATEIKEYFDYEICVNVDLYAPLPHSVESTLYAVVREAMINSARHANAQHGCVKIIADDSRVTFWVRDDGDGFDPKSTHANASHGIINMRERVQIAGGRMLIRSSAERGTLICGRIPLGG